MATRIAAAQDQPARGVARQKKAAGERQSRRALGDIGNLVTAPVVQGKPQTQISRPVTRSFGAQLLANAQAAAEKNKKQGEQVADLGLVAKKKTAIRRKEGVVTKTVVVVQKKPQPSIKNNIHSNKPPPPTKASEGDKPANAKATTTTTTTTSQCGGGRVAKEEEGSKKKKGHTFTSVLAARSKEASGIISKKPEELIVNIDEADADNELAVVEYVEELYQFYRLTEDENRVRDYMATMQPEISDRMRSILVDWMIEVHYKFELRPETLYLTINIVDRFLSMETVPRKELQLVGMSSLLIASKYEEIWATQVKDLVCISDRAYTNGQVLAMEKAILGKLGWELTVPTPYMFLPRYIKASIPSDAEMENMAFFLAELGLMSYSTTVSFGPSMLAASCVYAARCTLNKSPFWTETLKHYTGYSENQLMNCAKILAKMHSLAPESKLRAAYKKFSKPEFESVSLRSPAKILLA